MASETVTEGLAGYGIGDKVRALRLGRNLGLKQLSSHTGLSTAMLSKVERGLLFPTLPTLLRIALVFGVGLEHFFLAAEPRPQVAVVRKADRLRFPDHAGGDAHAYVFESLDYPAKDRKMESYYAEFEARSEAEPHRHAGAEVIYVMSGRLRITIEAEAYELAAGDSIYFDSGFPHAYARLGRTKCSAVVVVVRSGGDLFD